MTTPANWGNFMCQYWARGFIYTTLFNSYKNPWNLISLSPIPCLSLVSAIRRLPCHFPVAISTPVFHSPIASASQGVMPARTTVLHLYVLKCHPPPPSYLSNASFFNTWLKSSYMNTLHTHLLTMNSCCRTSVGEKWEHGRWGAPHDQGKDVGVCGRKGKKAFIGVAVL